jgi:hypothetical protein
MFKSLINSIVWKIYRNVSSIHRAQKYRGHPLKYRSEPARGRVRACKRKASRYPVRVRKSSLIFIFRSPTSTTSARIPWRTALRADGATRTHCDSFKLSSQNQTICHRRAHAYTYAFTHALARTHTLPSRVD